MRKGGQAEVEAKPERGAPPRGRRGKKAKTRRRTQESLIRKGGKADPRLSYTYSPSISATPFFIHPPPPTPNPPPPTLRASAADAKRLSG